MNTLFRRERSLTSDEVDDEPEIRDDADSFLRRHLDLEAATTRHLRRFRDRLDKRAYFKERQAKKSQKRARRYECNDKSL